MGLVKEAIDKAIKERDVVVELYSQKNGRRKVAEYYGINYNSVGHILKVLNLYNEESFKLKRKVTLERKRCENPFGKDGENLSYLLGYVLGDGSISVLDRKRS